MKGKRNFIVEPADISCATEEGRKRKTKKERVKVRGLVKTKILNFLPLRTLKDATRILDRQYRQHVQFFTPHGYSL